jgi:hypothetical protein
MSNRNSKAGTAGDSSTKPKLKGQAKLLLNPVLGDVLSRLHNAEYFFRLEGDDNGFYLSIITRKVYPRVWADNFQDGLVEIIAETSDNILNRTVLAEKDWQERWFGESIDECLYQAYEWMSAKNIA